MNTIQGNRPDYRRFIVFIAVFALALIFLARTSPAGAAQLEKIRHIIVIYMENRSFDHMFFGFPGADTAMNALFAKQTDKDGNEYKEIELPEKTVAAPRFVKNEPFNLDLYIPRSRALPNPIHRYYQNQFQINGGRNDRFVLFAGGNAKGLTMGYHSNSATALWGYAREFTLCDRFFMGAFGGSFLNHHWLVAALTPVFTNAPSSITASRTNNVSHFRDGLVTPDGYAVNTLFPEWLTAVEGDDPPMLPPQESPTIGDRLTENNISWKWYSQGWNLALKDLNSARHDPMVYFAIHHLPFLYYKTCKTGTECFRKNMADRDDLIQDIRKNNLPQVSFYKPGDALDQHPGTGTVDEGDRELDAVISEIRESPAWSHTVIIVTYDENGGFWDHVAPPEGDRWGPGSRVPAVIISPYAKKGFVDHTIYDTTSILKFIERRFNLKPLGGERKIAGDLLNALDLPLR